MTANKKNPTRKRTRTYSAVTGYGAKKTANPRETVTTPKAIWHGWIEVDDDGVPNDHIETGVLVVYAEPPVLGGWNAQYVRLVPAKPPRARKGSAQ